MHDIHFARIVFLLPRLVVSRDKFGRAIKCRFNFESRPSSFGDSRAAMNRPSPTLVGRIIEIPQWGAGQTVLQITTE